MKRNSWIGLGVAVVLVGGASAYFLSGSKEEVKWRYGKVDRGNIRARISATGTLNALVQVPVGTQVSGLVTGLYADFSSIVKKGQVIGKIDETPWLTQLHSAEAALQNAKDALAYADITFKRDTRLWNEKILDKADLDAAELALETAKGNLEEATAGLQTAKTNLGYCTLTAPVDGVVVARLVDVGQTVAASFSTPSVFSIAQDLSKMKVQAAIDEADVGQVKVGQQAFFTVDSYPDKQFHGIVSEVQLNPIITNNVVTFNVMMAVDNEPRFSLPSAGKDGVPGRGGEGTQPHQVGWRGGQGGAQAGGWAGHGDHRGGAVTKVSGPSEAGSLMSKTQHADIETTTARYIPPGSPIYKGELALFPGMSANCTIITKVVEQVLRVPSSALRFNPGMYLKDMAEKTARTAGQGQTQAGAHTASGSTGRGLVSKREDRIWILVDGKPKAIPVKIGATDGMFTEVMGEGVTEGMAVLTGVEELKKAPQASAMGMPGGMRR